MRASVAPRLLVLAALASGSSQASNSSRGISVVGGRPGPLLQLVPPPVPRLYATLSAYLCLLFNVKIPSKGSQDPGVSLGVNSTSEQRKVHKLVVI